MIVAEVVESPSLHLQLDCTGVGTSVLAVGLETDQADREQLEDKLPSHCRQYCPDSLS
jgi:hypothetical protein